MSFHLTVSERVIPGIADRKDDFLKIFSDEMARHGFRVKISRESGFDLIYSDVFGEAKIYALPENSLLRIGYKLGVSFIIFALAIIFPLFGFHFVVISAALISVCVVRILILRSALNESMENALRIIASKQGQLGG